jgi:hypothetical protein
MVHTATEDDDEHAAAEWYDRFRTRWVVEWHSRSSDTTKSDTASTATPSTEHQKEKKIDDASAGAPRDHWYGAAKGDDDNRNSVASSASASQRQQRDGHDGKQPSSPASMPAAETAAEDIEVTQKERTSKDRRPLQAHEDGGRKQWWRRRPSQGGQPPKGLSKGLAPLQMRKIAEDDADTK